MPALRDVAIIVVACCVAAVYSKPPPRVTHADLSAMRNVLASSQSILAADEGPYHERIDLPTFRVQRLDELAEIPEAHSPTE